MSWKFWKKTEKVLPRMLYLKEFSSTGNTFLEFAFTQDFNWFREANGVDIVYYDDSHMYILLDSGVATCAYDKKEIDRKVKEMMKNGLVGNNNKSK